MLIGGIVLGLLLGLRAGGRLGNLASIQLRWTWVLLAAVIVRFGTEALLNQGVDVAESIRLPLLTGGFALLLAGLWVNRGYPGMGLAFIGILLNAIVITINGGFMPIWQTALEAARFAQVDVTSALHIVLAGSAEDFLLRGLILGDVIPIPIPIVQNVASLGDLFLTLGLGFFLFAGVVRVPSLLEAGEEEAIRRRLASLAALSGVTGTTRLPRRDGATVTPETGLTPSIRDVAALQRPAFLGSGATGLASPSVTPWAAEPQGPELAAAAVAPAAPAPSTTAPPITLPRPSPETLARVRQHPYVRLALNGSFSALWAGQLISLFGDRIHLVALAFAVLISTGSALASSFVFVAGFIPNLLFSPIAGTFVDRWDHKEVMVVSDLLRAATVLLIPMAIVSSVWFVFPLVFLLTTISIFFRPARIAILPRIVAKDELVTANSALWVGETVADVVGFPLAGLFVGALGAAIPIAFWLDAATYIASAALISTLVIRKVTEHDEEEVEGSSADPEPATTATAANVAAKAATDVGFFAEMRAGYRFLRSEPTLFANTIQASVAQLNVGVLTALMSTYALVVFGAHELGPQAVYAFIESSVGVGNLIGGFVIGLVGSRLAKGKMISGGYAVWGLLTVVFALSGNFGVVMGLAFGSGVANMVFVIPSQAMFQERTPPGLMGRVVGFRFAMVFGSMALAMAVGGILTVFVPVTVVFALFGVITLGAGLAGFFVPAIRDAT